MVAKTYPKIDKMIEESVFKLKIDFNQVTIQQLTLDKKLALLKIVMEALENKENIDRYEKELEKDDLVWENSEF